MKLILALMAAAILALPAIAGAQTATPDIPLLSIKRASLAAGIDYAGYQNQGDQPLPSFHKAFEVGGYAAYVLTPHVTATGSAAYDLDNKWMRYRVGVRTVLWRGSDK